MPAIGLARYIECSRQCCSSRAAPSTQSTPAPICVKEIAVAHPFTYAVHGLKELMLKNIRLVAIAQNTAFLAGVRSWQWQRRRCYFARRPDPDCVDCE